MADQKTEALHRRQQEVIVPGVSLYYREPIAVAHAEGRTIHAQDGRSYLDFFGGILTVMVGHRHPHVQQAVRDQLELYGHTSTLYLTEPMVRLAEKLREKTPGDLGVTFFTAEGTEANDAAILMARLYSGRGEVIALRHGYSGRSSLGMTLTGQAPWRLGVTGVPGVVHAHNAYCYRCPFGKHPDSCGLECARDLEELIATQTTGAPAALLAEPVQGVGGFITPPEGYFHELVSIARRHGALFIDDEVQTGFGRTGRWFGIEHYGVQPDIMTFAKGLANGMPIGATTATPEVAQVLTGPHIATFGGNPIVMAAGVATLEVVETEGLVENAAARGAQLRAGLERLQAHYPVMGDVRGLGLMQGVEIVADPDSKEPAPWLLDALFEETKARGLLLGRGGLYNNCVRIAPPLTVTADEIDAALEALDGAFEAVYAAHAPLGGRR